jgi:hypothetical protein
MCWDESKWNKNILEMHKVLGRIRKDESLGYAATRIYALDDNAFAIDRISDGKAFVSIVNKGEARKLQLDSTFLPTDSIESVMGNGTIEREEKTTLEEALNWYDTSKYTAPYIPQEDTEHTNRYSIYWYRYVPGYVDPNAEFDFGGPEWERLIHEVTEYQTSSNESEPLKVIPYNFGLPS